MTELMQYNLTEYTNFRQLQLEYAKIRDENEQLKLKLKRVQKMYEQVCCATSREKGKQQKNNKQTQQKLRQLERQHYECQEEIKSIMHIIAGTFDKSNSERSHYCVSVLESLKMLHESLSEFNDDYEKSKRNLEQMFQDLNEREKDWGRREDQFSQEIAELQHDLADLEKMRVQMHSENNELIKENQELLAQIKSYKALALQARKKTQTKLQSEIDKLDNDASFGTDLLTYEKQLLARVFSLIIGSFHNNDIQVCLKKIYESYEDVTEAFRQKLQIQYDLQDLECQYQKEKNNSPREILVQLRGEINSFRKQLQSQKQILYEKENILQERVKDLSGQAVHDNRLKSFTIDLQAKLRKQKTGSQDSKKTQSLEWKQSVEPDEMMRQMIEKDRQNMENILKQTRFQFHK